MADEPAFRGAAIILAEIDVEAVESLRTHFPEADRCYMSTT